MSSSPATGFARAVSPISASTITTDTLGLEAGAISIPTADGQIHAYRDAGHACDADYRPSYNKAAEQGGWNRLPQWFKKYGAA